MLVAFFGCVKCLGSHSALSIRFPSSILEKLESDYVELERNMADKKLISRAWALLGLCCMYSVS